MMIFDICNGGEQGFGNVRPTSGTLVVIRGTIRGGVQLNSGYADHRHRWLQRHFSSSVDRDLFRTVVNIASGCYN